MPMAISARMNWIAWWWEMGTPNWILFWAYWVASSMAVRASPTAPAPIMGRVISRAAMAFLNPPLLRPGGSLWATRTFLKVTAVVLEARCPILSIGSPRRIPGEDRGDDQADDSLVLFLPVRVGEDHI